MKYPTNKGVPAIQTLASGSNGRGVLVRQVRSPHKQLQPGNKLTRQVQPAPFLE